MKRLLLVNSVCGTGSTGKCVARIAEEYEARNWEVRIGDGQYASVPESCKKWAVPIGSMIERRIHQILTRFLDWHADRVCSYLATRRFLKWAEEWRPDLLWLHNVHGYYLNYELLFKWIKRHPEMEVKWTLHDCWAFTGHCSHFLLTSCDRWKQGCFGCPEKGEYPKSWFLSAAKTNWERKRKAFCGVKKMMLITPSKWLADLTRESFLREYPIELVHNTIDTSVFKPTPSNVKDRLGVAGKKLVLGVASTWDRRKGLSDFYRLRELIDEQYAIVLVGLTQRQIDALPRGVVGIARTNSAKDLVELYSAADWFYNPTREDNYPTVNLEAVACGCRVVTYEVGGSAETVEGCSDAVILRGADKTPEGFIKVIAQGGV